MLICCNHGCLTTVCFLMLIPPILVKLDQSTIPAWTFRGDIVVIDGQTFESVNEVALWM